ncbi:hypothetical protein C0J52_13859 [Blattella germanica]|nr:hypothetical protein C0J52_13859 [Blattella germanica]
MRVVEVVVPWCREIDYPEVQGGRGGRGSFSTALTGRPELYVKSNRSSHSSDTSSAYSGSDTMASVQSSLDQDEVDLSGLIESTVDSDEEEDLADSMDSLTVRDTIRECLEKDPSERSEDDVETLLEFTQHLKAFTNMTLAVRRALCSVMVFAVVEKAGTVVMNDGEELDSWSVLINGQVDVEHTNGETEQLQVGDSFGILPTMDKLYHRGVMRTRCDDCQFVCITQTDYYRIQHQGEENIRRHEDNGRVVMVTEQRGLEGGGRRGHVVIRGSPERLMLQLIEENSIIDPTYVEDFLLTHRTFINNSVQVANQLLQWFNEAVVRDRVTRVVLLWVNNHFTDFETDPAMMEFLETFEMGLEREKMQGQLRLLNIACAAKARTRNVTLARPSRDEVLHFSILGAFKEMLQTPENSPRTKGRKNSDMSLLHSGPAIALTVMPTISNPNVPTTPGGNGGTPINSSPVKENGGVGGKKDGPKGFMTLGSKQHKLRTMLRKMNLLPKNPINDGVHTDENSFTSQQSQPTMLIHSHSNPDLMSICYDDLRSSDYPEHVLKVYKPDQTCKYLLVHKETTAHEVVMLALQEFGITEYYLKTNGTTETLVPDEMAPELIRESQVHFLQLNAVEVAIQLTLQDFSIFRQIESTEYVDDLFELKSRYGVPMLSQFAELVNREMFWVVTEVCSEHNLVRRSKIIKQFIKVARQCKECKNFNSMFAIVSGLGHGAVSRLRLSWEKLPSKYQRLFSDLQDLMDPSRNMSKYRQLVSSEQSQPPIIPFYPVVKKDLTFIHLGNDSKVEAGQPPSNAMVAMNHLTINSGAGGPGTATVKRRKKSTAQPNPKKMFEEAQMVRRVKAYLNNMRVITDEDKLHSLSLECEPSGSAPNSVPVRKRHPSPTLSTTSSTSSTSEGKKGITGTKFGAASPQAVRKILALSDPNKTRPHQPRHPPQPPLPIPGLAHLPLSPSPSPGSHRRMCSSAVVPGVTTREHHGAGGRALHERSHSDTPTLPLPSVDLSAESSSVTSLSNLPLRKTLTSGSVTSSDSGHSTQLDSHSNSSVEVAAGASQGGCSPPHRRHSSIQAYLLVLSKQRRMFGLFTLCMRAPEKLLLGLVSLSIYLSVVTVASSPPSWPRPPFPHAVPVLPPIPPYGCVMPPPREAPPRPRHPPDYRVAAQMARLQRLGRAHSHEGVTGGYYNTDPEEDGKQLKA